MPNNVDSRVLIPGADTIVYAVSGQGAIVSENGKKRQELAPGDFALIPAYVRSFPLDTPESYTYRSRLSIKKSMMATRKSGG